MPATFFSSIVSLPKDRKLKQNCGQILLALVLVCLLGQSAGAEDPTAQENSKGPGIFSAQFENDGFSDKDDGGYTYGFRLSYLSDGKTPEWLQQAANHLPFYTPEDELHTIYYLGQSAFTPEDIEKKSLIVDDRPYAGWLYVGLGLISDRKEGAGKFNKRRDSIELNVGIVGPAALAKQVQTLGHDIRSVNEAEGWDNQLENEPGIMLLYDRQWQGRFNIAKNGLSIDLIPHIGVALGNIMTHAATGMTVRFGRNQGSDYSVPLIRPGAPGSTYFSKSPGLSWYLFAGAEGRAVLQNIFLDGNSFEDSHSVDKKTWVGDFLAGLVFIWGDYRLSFTNVNRSREFDEQRSSSQYGSLNFSMRF